MKQLNKNQKFLFNYYGTKLTLFPEANSIIINLYTDTKKRQ
jgi:hypothetical protein